MCAGWGAWIGEDEYSVFRDELEARAVSVVQKERGQAHLPNLEVINWLVWSGLESRSTGSGLNSDQLVVRKVGLPPLF